MKDIIMKFKDYAKMSKEGFQEELSTATEQIKKSQVVTIIAQLDVEIIQTSIELKRVGIEVCSHTTTNIYTFKQVCDALKVLKEERETWLEIQKGMFEE